MERIIEAKGWRIIDKLAEIIIITGKVTKESKFFCATCRKEVGSNTIFYQYCRCWVRKRCSHVRGKLREDSKLKSQRYKNQQKIDITKDYPDIELNR